MGLKPPGRARPAYKSCKSLSLTARLPWGMLFPRNGVWRVLGLPINEFFPHFIFLQRKATNLLDELHERGGAQLLNLALVHAGLVIPLRLALRLARHIGRGVFCRRNPRGFMGRVPRNGHPAPTGATDARQTPHPSTDKHSASFVKARLQKGPEGCASHGPQPFAASCPISSPTRSDGSGSLEQKDKARKENKKHFFQQL